MTVATTGTNQTAPVMDRLKAETRAAHDATEAIPFSQAMMNRTLPRDRYVGQLLAYGIVHRALDQALAATNHPVVSAVWSDDLAKTDLLERDVAFFLGEMSQVPQGAVDAARRFAAAIDEAAENDPVSLLGTLYVLEGSTLGATILRGHVAAAYDLQGEDGLAYYSPYGNQVMPHWMQFKQRMNAAVTDPAEQDRIVAAAVEAFERVGDILQALSDGVAAPASAPAGH